MEYHLAALENSRARVITVPRGESPSGLASGCHVLNSYIVKAEAQERCNLENDPARSELLTSGQLKVHKTR
jgi:hypothetical protein